MKALSGWAAARCASNVGMVIAGGIVLADWGLDIAMLVLRGGGPLTSDQAKARLNSCHSLNGG